MVLAAVPTVGQMRKWLKQQAPLQYQMVEVLWQTTELKVGIVLLQNPVSSSSIARVVKES